MQSGDNTQPVEAGRSRTARPQRGHTKQHRLISEMLPCLHVELQLRDEAFHLRVVT